MLVNIIRILIDNDIHYDIFLGSVLYDSIQIYLDLWCRAVFLTTDKDTTIPVSPVYSPQRQPVYLGQKV